MAKRKNDWSEKDNDWGEYRKDSKKKHKHREEANTNWKRSLNFEHVDDDYDDYETRGRTDRW